MQEAAAYERYQGAGRLHALDGLRAIAAALVVAHHSTQVVPAYLSRSIGVTIFFVISGFLITRILLREKESTGTIALGHFLMRRTLRIFPLYYVVLGVYAVLAEVLERGTPAGEVFWRGFPAYLTFTSNWFVTWEDGKRVMFYFAWSMAVQEQFYLIWPVILRSTRRRWAAVLPVLFLLSSELVGSMGPPGTRVAALASRVVASVDSPIYFGVLTALVLQNQRAFAFVHWIAGRSWSVPVAALAFATPLVLPGEPQDLVNLSACFLVMACALSRSAVLRSLDNPVLRHVGKVSYGIYLLHMLVENAIRRFLPGHGSLVIFSLTFAITIVAASVSYSWFEQPFLHLRETLLASPEENSVAIGVAIRSESNADSGMHEAARAVSETGENGRAGESNPPTAPLSTIHRF